MRVSYRIGTAPTAVGPAAQAVLAGHEAAQGRPSSPVTSNIPECKPSRRGAAPRRRHGGPGRFPALGVTAACLFTAAGCASLDSARNQDGRAWRIDPVLDIQHSAVAAHGHYGVGRYHDGMRAWAKAADSFRKAILADPRHAEAHSALGVALARLGRHDDAELAFRRAVELAPERAHMRSNYGFALLLEGRLREALVELKAAVKLDPHNRTALGNLRQAVERWEVLQTQAQAVAVPNAVHTSPVATGTVVAVPTGPVTDLARSVVSAGQTAAPPARARPSPAFGEAAGAQTISVAAPITVVNRAESFADIVQMPSLLATTAAVPQGVQVFDQPTVPAWPRAIAGVLHSAHESLPPAKATPVALAMPNPSARAGPAEAGTEEAGPRRADVRLELSNGNGINGMASSLGRWLARQDVKTSRLTNQRPFVQERTVVQYRRGQEEAAWRVMQALPVATETGPVLRDGLTTDVRVVLGQDWRNSAACMFRDDCPSADRVATSTGPGSGVR